jgi:aryl-alcohol dehydrogenase-like predicted oxidoreductase
MQYVNLGTTGLKVSRLCLGCMSYGSPQWRAWVLDEEASRPFIQKALEAGINFFDTANVYSLGMSEEILGRAIRDFARRDEVVLATKVFNPMSQDPNGRGLSRKHILSQVDASLKRLGTDYIDLYQIHRWDYSTPIEETLETLHELVRSGRVRYIGASSMYAYQFAKALYTSKLNGWSRFVSMQNHYNLLYREEEREMIPLCREEGIGLIPWSPLARGYLARRPEEWGSTLRGSSDDYSRRLYEQTRASDETIVRTVFSIAEARGLRPAQVALAWLLSKPYVTAPIIGATKLHHLEEALGALEVQLSPDEISALEAPYLPHPIQGHR